jgi:hypothetical protein
MTGVACPLDRRRHCGRREDSRGVVIQLEINRDRVLAEAEMAIETPGER